MTFHDCFRFGILNNEGNTGFEEFVQYETELYSERRWTKNACHNSFQKSSGLLPRSIFRNVCRPTKKVFEVYFE